MHFLREKRRIKGTFTEREVRFWGVFPEEDVDFRSHFLSGK